MGKNPPKWLPGERVNETILMQRKSVAQLKADSVIRKDKRAEMHQKHKDKIDARRKRKLTTKKFITAQSILKYAQRKRHQAKKFHKIGEKVDTEIKHQGDERLQKSFQASGIALVVRAKGKLIPREVSLAFARLGLKKIYSARMIHVNKKSMKLIRQLRPFSIVGYPTKDQIEKLIRTRGCLWNEETQSKRVITGNRLIEEVFGQYNVLCVEDLTEAIANKAEGVDDILKHLAPFDFHPPRQLFVERHRSAHQKLEIVNPESFAAYLHEQLEGAKKSAVAEKKAKAREEAQRMIKIEASKRKAAEEKTSNNTATVGAQSSPKETAAKRRRDDEQPAGTATTAEEASPKRRRSATPTSAKKSSPKK